MVVPKEVTRHKRVVSVRDDLVHWAREYTGEDAAEKAVEVALERLQALYWMRRA